MQVGAVEAQDVDVAVRHLDMEYSAIRWSDLPYTSYGTSGPKARDGIAMAEIVHGGRAAIEETPALMGVVNPNSPLVWDFRMADALLAWAEAGQPVIVTPFLLAGATAPVSVAGGLAQQVAEALSGVALAQLVRPGTPCLYGSFFTATDMRTGSPAFGTPESVWGVLAGGQLARHYGLPFRGGGGLASSNTVDAQAAAESTLMLWATVLARTDVVLHAAGWLEGGLTASFEKFALDVELLEQFARQSRGIGFTRGGAGVRRAEGGRARRPLPGEPAHDGPLPRVAVHEPAVHDARRRDLGERGRARHAAAGVRGVAEAAGLLRGPGHRPGDRRGAPRVRRAAPAGSARAGRLTRFAPEPLAAPDWRSPDAEEGHMGKRVTWVAAALVAATALVASWVSVSAAGPNVLRIAVIEHATTDTVVDLTTNGDSTGDLLTFHNEIFDVDNETVIGTDQGECVRIEVGVSWECRWITSLEVGSLTIEGPFFDAAPSVMAITGGTGQFRGARGSMRLVARDDLGTEYDFVFRVFIA